jgi:hypothetical protein
MAGACDRICHFRMKRIKTSRTNGNKNRSKKKVLVSKLEKNMFISVTDDETPMAIHR